MLRAYGPLGRDGSRFRRARAGFEDVIAVRWLMFAFSAVGVLAGCGPPDPGGGPRALSSRPSEPERPGPVLGISLYGEDRTVPVAETTEVTIGGEVFRVQAIRPWSGLMRTATGEPMAQVSVRVGNESARDVYLLDGVWREVGDDLSLILHWHETEDAAREAAARPHDPVAGARWGVRDGASVHWFDTFTPGVGGETSDGMTVELVSLGRRDDQPAIEVAIRGDADEQRKVITPGDESGRVLFEVPGMRRYVVNLHAWRDAAVLLAATSRAGVSTDVNRVSTGDVWQPDALPIAVRVGEVLHSAVPVEEVDSPLQEIVLKGPAGRLRVREGEAVRVGDALVRFSAGRVADNDSVSDVKALDQ